MNAILKDSEQVQFYTYLGPIFEAIKNRQLNYIWLLTDLELNWIPDDLLDYCEQYELHETYWDRDNKYLITGDKLTKLISKHKIQFIWGVLTGFKKSINPNINKLDVCPFAENPDLWKSGASLQHPEADIEIVCWDSTLTLLLSKDQSIVNDFKSYFTEARDLDEYNLED